MNTVKDLILALEKIEDKNLAVHLEGCDCYQDWNGEIKIKDNGYLLLLNTDHHK